MQTTPLPASAGVAATPAPAAKTADKSAPDAAFSLLLTQEMTQQQPPPAPPSPQPAANASRDKPAGDRVNASNQGDREQEAPATEVAKAGERKPDAGKEKADNTVDNAAQTPDAEAKADKADAAAPADMLAFMATLQQLQPRPDTPAARVAASADPALSATHGRQAATGIPPHLAAKANAANAADAANATGAAPAAKTAGEKDKPGFKPDPFAARLAEAGKAAPPQEAALPAPALPDVRAEATISLPEALPKLAETENAAMPLPATQLPGIHALQTAAGQLPDKLTPPVGSPAWDQALGQKVVWMASGEQQSATLTLNPPDLGPLQIVLTVNNAQADATFTAAQPEVRQALEAALPKLRDMLGDAGIQLGQASVNSGTPGQQGGFEQRDASGRAYRGQDSDPAEAASTVSRVAPAAGGIGLVDTFA